MKLTAIQLQHAQILLGQSTHDSHLPEGKVEPGEKVLGTIEDPVARSLYSLHVRTANYVSDYLETLRPSTREEAEKLKAKLDEVTLHANVINRAAHAVKSDFWARVYELFPETANSGVEAAIREGFQVVVWKSEGNPLSGLAGAVLVEIVGRDSKADSEPAKG
ncbi:MAG: hypothetical protein HZA81_01995 [Candidatus Taylorbacteria bacterium]|nr:hypothetical protein [Candidatus Taylorbacteria bacterium]